VDRSEGRWRRWGRMPQPGSQQDGVEIDKCLRVPLVPIDDRLQKQSEDGIGKGETHGPLCWQINQSLPACARAGFGSVLTVQDEAYGRRSIRRHSPERHVRKLRNQLPGLGYEVTLNLRAA
jgi:hypothetical protein